MGGVFAACTKTPIASLVMVSEITGSYGLAVPLMMTCASAYILSRTFTMNEEQVPGIADSPAHRGDFLVNVLEDLHVSDAMVEKIKPELFTADTPFRKIVQRVKDCQATSFPVVDDNGFLVGIFTLSDIRRIMNQPEIGNLIVAGDLGTTDVATVTMHTNLDDALRKFTRKNVDELPVVDESNTSSAKLTSASKSVRRPRGPVGTRRVIGMLSRRDLISAYHRKLHAIQSDDASENRGSHVFVDALETPQGPRLDMEMEFPDEKGPLPVTDPSKQEADLLDEPLDDSRKIT
jgi:CIC family chloride channel protein